MLQIIQHCQILVRHMVGCKPGNATYNLQELHSINYRLWKFYLFPTKKLQNKLKNVQCSAIRSSLGYRISTPKNILLAESKLTSLKDHARQLGCSFLLKILSNPNCKIQNLVTRYLYNPKNTQQTNILNKCLLIVNKFSLSIYTSRNYNMYCYDYSVGIKKNIYRLRCLNERNYFFRSFIKTYLYNCSNNFYDYIL